MTDLEGRIRELLEDDAHSAPPPLEPKRAVRRTHRRQALTVVGGALVMVVAVAGVFVGVRAVDDGRGTPAVDPSATRTTTVNGVSITHPAQWSVFDPDELELNGPPNLGRPGLPRLVLALSPTEPDELFGCPGMAEGTKPSFLMTVQEEPLSLAGGSAVAWPVPLEPLVIESAGNDPVESGESGCYPDWEFLRAGWTAEGRTLEARVGFAPDATADERKAVMASYESMTFEPAAAGATAAVIATGTAGGEDWELVAQRQNDELVLTLQAETIGGGGGGFDPASPTLTLIDHVLGEGDTAERIVFGAVPVGTTQVNVRDGDSEGVYEVLDVPDSIDAELDAFVFTTYPEAELQVVALDASGEILAMGEVVAGGGGSDPVETPLPSVVDVAPEHGGRYFAVYLWAGESPDDPQAQAARDAAEQLGFNPGGGDLACDDGAGEQLGVPEGWSGVAIYFATRQDAETAFAWLLENNRAPAAPPVGIAEVTTYCLD